MTHKAWSSIEEVSYCFSRSSVKFQGHTALTIIKFDPNWAFPDCNWSFNSPIATKWCTKVEVAWKRRPVVLQGHPSNFKATWDKTPILIGIERFRTVTPVWIHPWLWNDAHWCSMEEVPYYFPRLSIKFVGHAWQKIVDFDPNWAFQDCNSSLNSEMLHKAWSSIEEVSYCF